ncbi:MAG TPA: VOC family protein [Candidatus Angelobacter sp.]
MQVAGARIAANGNLVTAPDPRLPKEACMPVQFCIPVIPSANLEKSLRLWVEGLGFAMSSEMHTDNKLIFCMLQKDNLWFMLNQRAGDPAKPKDYDGIRLYWTPGDINETRAHLQGLGYGVSELEDREYGQTEFFLTDDDGFTHCFGVSTQSVNRQK